jgi:hypothetical protein
MVRFELIPFFYIGIYTRDILHSSNSFTQKKNGQLIKVTHILSMYIFTIGAALQDIQ